MRLTRAERQAQTRQALVDAAATLVVERGYAAASVEAISARAGFTRGAFYANFSSKEELLAEVLQQRVYAAYSRLAEDVGTPGTAPSPTELGERLARMQDDPDGAWLFRIWLELLAHAAREPGFREIAAGFWRANRAASAHAIERLAESQGEALAEDPKVLATISIALDIGLALQRFVDPDDVPASVYPAAYELLHRGGARRS
jgi:AcrR family transcriptional regulator